MQKVRACELRARARWFHAPRREARYAEGRIDHSRAGPHGPHRVRMLLLLRRLYFGGDGDGTTAAGLSRGNGGAACVGCGILQHSRSTPCSVGQQLPTSSSAAHAFLAGGGSFLPARRRRGAQRRREDAHHERVRAEGRGGEVEGGEDDGERLY